MIRTFLIYLPSTVLPRARAFITILVGTRLLAPSEYGLFALVTVIGEFCDMTFTNWVRISLARFGAHASGVPYRFARRMAYLSALCTIIAICISSLAAAILAQRHFVDVATALAAYVTGNAVARYGITLHQGMENHGRASLLEAARASISLIVTVAMMAGTHRFLAPSVASSAVSLGVGIIAAWTGLARTNRDTGDEVPLRTIMRFAAPLVVLALLSQAISSCDKFIIKGLEDAATLGFYTAAFSVGRSGFDAIAVAFNTGAFIRLSALFNAGESANARHLLARQLTYIPAVAFPAAGFIIASRDLIARVLFPAAYYHTFVTVIPFVILGAIALNLKNFVFDNIFFMYLRNARQIPTLLVGAAVPVALAHWLFELEPVLGASVMFASGAIASLIMSIALTSGLLRVPVEWRAGLLVIASGAGAWGLVTLGRHELAGHIPNIVLLGLLSAVSALAVGLSLFIAHTYFGSATTKAALDEARQAA